MIQLRSIPFFESRDAVFYENRFTSIPNINETRKHVEPLLKPQKDVIVSSEPRRSKRIRTEKSFGPNFIVYLVEGTRDSISKQTSVSPSIEPDPLSFDEAMKSQDSAFWKEAIKDEMDSIMGNKTWKLVDLPPGSVPVGCKWIFKKKMKADGTIDKFKARLVAKGFKQQEGID